MEHAIEITQEAFYSIVNSFDKPSKLENNELCMKAYYNSKGLNLMTIYNFTGAITQYYAQDINA